MNNDSISRSELKAYARKVICGDNPTNTLLIRMFDEIIDKAPSVPLPDFKEGYKQAIIDGQTNFSRPQGEWLWLGDNPSPNHKWSCNKCGRGVKEQENFCPNCGADMRKGGAKE